MFSVTRTWRPPTSTCAGRRSTRCSCTGREYVHDRALVRGHHQAEPTRAGRVTTKWRPGMTDLLNELKAVERAVGSRPVSPDDAREARTIVLSRRYDAPIDDVWDAVTDPERISR